MVISSLFVGMIPFLSKSREVVTFSDANRFLDVCLFRLSDLLTILKTCLLSNPLKNISPFSSVQPPDP
jgi:hypothetical protein